MQIQESQETKKTFSEQINDFLSQITVEPVVFGYGLAANIANLATQNLNLEKACRVNLQFDEDLCDAIALRNRSAYNTTHEVAVQKLVATGYIWKNVIQYSLPLLILPFLGAWADRNKRRKFCILLPIFGEIFTNVGLLVCTYFYYELPLEFTVASDALPGGLTAGTNAILLGMCSYISTVSSESTRTLRMGAAIITYHVGVALGISFSGILFKTAGFYGAFSTAVVLYVAAVLYGIFFVKEDITGRAVKTRNFLSDFFNFAHLSDTFKTAFVNGGKLRRTKMCLLVVLSMLITGPIQGEFNVMYLFTRYKFHWNEINFSIFATIYLVVHVSGQSFSLAFFSRFLKFDDALLGTIANVSKISACLLYAFAPNPLIFHIGIFVECLNGGALIAIRTIASKLVSSQEIGKINSIIGLSEAIAPLIYGAMYSAIYRATINVLPGTYYLVSSSLTVPALIIFTWFYLKRKRPPKK